MMTNISSIVLPARLVLESVQAGRSTKLSAHGFSMYPLLRPGDQLHLRHRPAAELRKGDVIAFVAPNQKMMAHRIIAVQKSHKGLFFLCQGDNSLTPDQPVREEQLLGLIYGVTRHGKFIPLDTPSFRYGKFFFNHVPLAHYAVRMLYRMYY